ncbi:chitobiase/beta-hexosaminidase C-terminal domain-containing protein [Flavihumibacter sp. RY-1]|uniref:Chitobiase/beta-hexosaminidase C-terminal domain-containing protein n=1 Tax=Flavihumibacter fluminis TaxID=2909236 RepID=A0ABS9BDZ7_9BACT|nr:FN3 associated domain-containing protein [Flavihumibacter fluminis]MCF1713530.1 chitobiase/beta-hexosaminidase C-terminal domain-containing protein [Flavihumibacter fluminis]
MRTWKTLLYNLAFAANTLLLFFVLAEQWVVIPSWLQVAGRMHPLLLHFPIVLLLLLLIFEWMPQARNNSDGMDLLWLGTLNLTVFSALFGWILSREEGYGSDAVTLHKWGGVFLSLFALVWYHLRKWMQSRRIPLSVSSALMIVGLILTGHQGAVLTHGDDFLLAPVKGTESSPPVAFEDAIVYDHVIQPILEAKCVSCHNSSKAKGELVMETAASLLRGGKNGLLWDTTAKEYGLLLQRVHLPLNHKEHMPPKGKPQLSDEEIAILYHWIKSGSSMDGKLADLPETDSLRLLTASLFVSGEEAVYAFSPASESVIEKLNSHYRIVQPIAAESPALEVNYFGASQFKPEELKDLLQIKEQLVHLNLNRMPVTDEDLELLKQFPNLRNLNLSFSGITDKALPVLKQLPSLRELSLSGTAVTTAGLSSNPIPVKSLYCWSTGVKPEDVPTLQKAWGETRLETGFAGDTILIQLNPPIVQNDEQIFSQPFELKLKHFVQGADLRYTLDGSEPDSLQSPVYKGPITISKSTQVKARAFKKGWISSATVSRQFFGTGGKPDSIRLLTAPDPSYKGSGAQTLIDEVKGDGNFRSGKWLGYKDKDLEVQVEFKEPRNLQILSVSTLVGVGSYIMPPKEIQVWGAEQDGKPQLVAKEIPRQHTMDTVQYQKIYSVKLPEKKYKQLKIIVKHLPVLPSWHPGKGTPGWVFVDELFFE